MQVILLEQIEKLGALGDLVTVKPGYARNYLLPMGKALRASKQNIAHFEAQKIERLATQEESRGEAEKQKAKMHAKTVVIIRAASESTQLYGSVTARNVADAISETLLPIDKRQVVMQNPVKNLGIFDFRINLHPQVFAIVKVNVAQSAEEAVLQAERIAHDEMRDKAGDADVSQKVKASERGSDDKKSQPSQEQEQTEDSGTEDSGTEDSGTEKQAEKSGT